MDKWVPVVLIVVLLGGSGGGYLFASSTYASQVRSLETQLATTQQQLTEKTEDYTNLMDDYQTLSQTAATLEANKASLQSSYDALRTSYDSLQATHDSLQDSYDSLQASYDSLQDDYTTLSAQYDTLRESVDSGLASLSDDYVALQREYDSLSQTLTNNVYGTPGDTQMLNYFYQLTLAVRSLNTTLWEYCNEVSSFRNTLTAGEVLKMEPTVRSIVGSSQDDWANYQKIHQYITSNVKYVCDIDFPYIGQYLYIDVNGVRYLTDFDVGTTTNYVQTPDFTLQYKQGDCDDQAALEYAMIRYYNKYMVGVDYNLYLAEMKFADGSGHVAVFMPVSGGKVTILDPAGNYLTSTYSTIAAKAAATELDSYNSFWLSSSGSITQITLYTISMLDGSYTVASHGTLAQVASFLSS